MSKQTTKSTVVTFAIAAALVLAGPTILTGCKESPDQQEPATSPGSQQQQPKDESKPSEPARSDVNTAKKDLSEVVKLAKGWGIASEYAPMFAKQAPDFTLTDINGKQHKLSDYKDRDVMIVFWATWCPPCKREVPHLVELRNSMDEQELALLAISHVSEYPPNTADMIKEFAQTKKINYAVFALERGQVGAPYDSVNALPTVFFIRPDGKIKIVTAGLMELEDIKAVLEADWPEQAYSKQQ